MKNENGLNQLNENVKEHKPFKFFWRGEYFATFEYDDGLKRYQSPVGWLSVEEVFEFGKGVDKDRTIKWIDNDV